MKKDGDPRFCMLRAGGRCLDGILIDCENGFCDDVPVPREKFWTFLKPGEVKDIIMCDGIRRTQNEWEQCIYQRPGWAE